MMRRLAERGVDAAEEKIMFCDGCGATLQAGAAFCSRCARPIAGPVVMAQMQPRPGRVQRHVHLLGILWLAESALHALGGLMLLVAANTIFAHGGPTPDTPSFLHPLLSVLGIAILAKSALGFLTGWGLMQRESWARVLALVLGFISLFNPPFGTALGIYTLWVLLPQPSQTEYEQLVQTQAA
jgi:hypothetical protein